MELTDIPVSTEGVTIRSTKETSTVELSASIHDLFRSLQFVVNGKTYVLENNDARGGMGTVVGLSSTEIDSSLEKPLVVKYSNVPIPFKYLNEKLNNKLIKQSGSEDKFEIFGFDIGEIDYSLYPNPSKISFLELKNIPDSNFATAEKAAEAKNAMGLIKEAFITKKLQNVPGTTNFREDLLFLKKGDECYPFFFMERVGSNYQRTLDCELKKLYEPNISLAQRIEFLKKLHIIAGVIDSINFGVVEGVTLIHRDIKPDNILFNDDGEPVLIDYSVGVLNGATLDDIVGTLHYISPEQILSGDDLNKVDQYAAGLIYLEALVDSEEKLNDILPRRVLNVSEIIDNITLKPGLSDNFEIIMEQELNLDMKQATMLGLLFRMVLDRNTEFRFFNTSTFSKLAIGVLEGNEDAYRCVEYSVLSRLNFIEKSKDPSSDFPMANIIDVNLYEGFMNFANEHSEFVDDIFESLPDIFKRIMSDKFKSQRLTEILECKCMSTDRRVQSDLYDFVSSHYPAMIKLLQEDIRDLEPPVREIPKTLDYA